MASAFWLRHQVEAVARLNHAAEGGARLGDGQDWNIGGVHGLQREVVVRSALRLVPCLPLSVLCASFHLHLVHVAWVQRVLQAGIPPDGVRGPTRLNGGRQHKSDAKVDGLHDHTVELTARGRDPRST